MGIAKKVRKKLSLDSADKLQFRFPCQSLRLLENDAIGEYNRRRTRFGQKSKIIKDKNKISKSRKDRVVLNYLRHNKTNYDKISKKKKPAAFIKRINRAMMHDKIEKAARKRYGF